MTSENVYTEIVAERGAKVIPDLLRGNAGNVGEIGALLDLSADEIDSLRAELETERMRLVACSVISLANTPESAASAREMHPDYQSPSCNDVARAVDREIALRAELEECKEMLRHIAVYAHDRSTGPAVHDALLEIRGMAYAALAGEGDQT